MTSAEKRELINFATDMRMCIIESVYSARSGHPGGSLSSADILAYLYKKELHIFPHEPRNPSRDRFVLSKGHAAPALYSALALCGFFPKGDLLKLRQMNSYLQGHPNINTVPGVDISTGSLGQGISCAVGVALGGKLSKSGFRTYALVGDGELQEGQVWEAMMSAAHYKLNNLCVIIDNNRFQIDGNISDIMNPDPITDKAAAFGLNVIEADGHDFDSLEAAFNAARRETSCPTCIVAHTIKGKGVSFMENTASWHGKAPNEEQYNAAIAELSSLRNGGSDE